MQKLKVLIADDNPRMASMIQNILMDDDEIQVVGTAEDGVETFYSQTTWDNTKQSRTSNTTRN